MFRSSVWHFSAYEVALVSYLLRFLTLFYCWANGKKEEPGCGGAGPQGGESLSGKA
jgi:hypothetical protein